MSTILYLVRHGETPWNKLFRFQGRTDIELSKEGIWQAERLQKRFNKEFDVIYTSPLSRAIQTANIISQGMDIAPHVYRDLIEIDFGKWEGQSFTDIRNNFPKEHHLWLTDEDTGPLMGGELNMKAATIRGKNAILDIAKENSGKRTLVVAHGGIIKAALLGIFNLRMNMYHSLFLDNTSVTTLKFREGQAPVILGLNDTSHLKEGY